MTRSSSETDTMTPEEISVARRAGIITALANQALSDGDFAEALVVAAANIIGVRAVQSGKPIEDYLEVVREISTDVMQANTPAVIQ